MYSLFPLCSWFILFNIVASVPCIENRTTWSEHKQNIYKHINQTFVAYEADLREVALLIDQSQYVERFNGQQVQGFLVVTETNALPWDAFFTIFILLQLKDVTHKELLQVLVGIINAQLLKTKQWAKAQRKYI